MNPKPTHYEVLGIPRTASSKDITRAYRQKARQYHEDVAPPDEADNERFARATEAFNVLRDKERRLEYDEQLAHPGVGAKKNTNRVRADESPVGSSPSPFNPDDHVAKEPLLPALAGVLWRLTRAGVRALPVLLRRGPQVLLVAGGLFLGVVISSWTIRSCSNLTDEVQFQSSLPDTLNASCTGDLGFGDVPAGSSAALDCDVRGVSVRYFDTEGDSAERYFARHLRRAKRQMPIRGGPAGSCSRSGHVTAYRYRSGYGPSGRVFCWVTSQGQVRFEWTDGGVYAQAGSRLPYAWMYRWWRKHAGPLGDAENEAAQPKVR